MRWEDVQRFEIITHIQSDVAISISKYGESYPSNHYPLANYELGGFSYAYLELTLTISLDGRIHAVSRRP